MRAVNILPSPRGRLIGPLTWIIDSEDETNLIAHCHMAVDCPFCGANTPTDGCSPARESTALSIAMPS